ncbi:hypothetical protein SPHINGOT1_140029 [Sphingomonas sp. T1]|nr:hypothetical protein SPHINGOT1_140029 [Sphingomonas sp. T1]
MRCSAAWGWRQGSRGGVPINEKTPAPGAWSEGRLSVRHAGRQWGHHPGNRGKNPECPTSATQALAPGTCRRDE